MQVGICIAGGVNELNRVDLDLLRQVGVQSLFIGCYENEMRWQAGQVATFVRDAATTGFEVCSIPWGYGKVLDPDPAIPSLYTDTHRAQLQIDSRGRRCAKACPNNPQFLEWFASEMRTAAWMLEVHGFLWDEPSFYNSRTTWACRCEYCQRLFYAAENVHMPREINQQVRAFRRFSISMFILAATAAIQSVDSRLYSLVMPRPTLDTAMDNSGTADWGQLLESSAVDGLALYVPWQERNVRPDQAIAELHNLAARKQNTTSKPCHLWIPASPRPQDRVIENLLTARDTGVPRVVLTDYSTVFRAPDSRGFISRLQDTIAKVSG
jgi:hypothetical protein